MTTRREIFARVRDHLLVQGVRSRIGSADTTDGDEGTVCAYRGRDPDGRPVTCAVGCLIPDGLYDPALECTSAEFLCGIDSGVDATAVQRAARDRLRAGLPDVFNPDNGELLDRLQSIHDSVPPDMWEARLRGVEGWLDGGDAPPWEWERS